MRGWHQPARDAGGLTLPEADRLYCALCAAHYPGGDGDCDRGEPRTSPHREVKRLAESGAERIPLSVLIAKATCERSARCQLELSASRALRWSGVYPGDWTLVEPEAPLCSHAMAGEIVPVEVRRG